MNIYILVTYYHGNDKFRSQIWNFYSLEYIFDQLDAISKSVQTTSAVIFELSETLAYIGIANT